MLDADEREICYFLKPWRNEYISAHEFPAVQEAKDAFATTTSGPNPS